MAQLKRVLDYENVNGVHLTLKIEKRISSSNSMSFTISFKNKENKSHWPKMSLILAILFNMFSLIYIRINITVILVIIIVSSFLVFFWITHSVQSESILVIPTVGIQNSIKYVLGREDVFVPWANIDDVIINEVIKLFIEHNCRAIALPVVSAYAWRRAMSLPGIQRNRVLYYLTLIVKTGAIHHCHFSQESEGIKLIPLFKYTKPRLVMLETIYSELQTLLVAAQRSAAEVGSGDIEY